MLDATWPKRVLLLYEGSNFGGDFDTSFVQGFEANGCDVTSIQRGHPWPPDFDLVMGYGPFTYRQGNILPVARQLQDIVPAERPIFVWLLTEGTPDPQYPTWFVKSMSKMRLTFDNWLDGGFLSPLARSPIQNLAFKGHRLRIFGQLDWIRQRGLLDVLAVTAASRAQYLRQRGFNPIVTPLGYHPIYGTDLNLKREIDVAFIGNTSADRRQQLMPDLVDQLAKLNIQVAIRNKIYGDARTKFLNQSRILLNILRAPHDFVGQRFLLGIANKALVISEPTLDNSPFVNGEHLVEAPLDDLVDTIQFYLTHEEQRLAIVERAYRFVTEELTSTQMIGSILAHARQVKATKLEMTAGGT